MGAFFAILIFFAFLILPLYLLISVLTMKSDIEEIKRVQKRLQNEIYKTPEVIETTTPCEPNIKKEVEKLYEIEQTDNVNKDKDEDKHKKSSDFEKMFLGNIFNKIGAVALIVGIGIFVKMVSQYITITKEIQILSGYLVSFGVIFFGFHLHNKNSKTHGEVLCGVGIAGLLISTYTAVSLYNIITPEIAVAAGFLIVVFSYFISNKFKTFSTIALGLFGAYFNLFFVNNNIGAEFLFIYLILINLMSVVYVKQNPDKISLNLINLSLSAICASIFIENQETSLLYPVLLWLIYFVNDFISIIKNKYTNTLEILNWLNFAVLIWFVNYIFHFENKMQIGLVVILFAIVYIIAQFIANRINNQIQKRIYFQNALLAILASTFLLTNGMIRPIAYCFEGLLLSYLYFIFDLKEFKNYTCAFVCAGVLAIFPLDGILFSNNLELILNQRLLLFGVCSVFIGLCGYLISKKDKSLSEIFYFVSLSLIYLYMVFEVNSIFESVYNKLFIDVVICTIYSLNMQKLFNKTQNSLFRFASCFIYILAIVLMLFGLVFDSDYNFNTKINTIPFLNLQSAGFLSLIVSGLILDKNNKDNILKYFAVLLGALMIYLQTCELAKLVYSENIAILGSAGLIIYSGIIILSGIFKNIKWLKVIGIWIVLFSIIKMLFFDLASIDAIFKLIAFVVLGGCLMIVSYYYSKISGK